MDAPIYPPAQSFDPPVAAPFELAVQNVTIAELLGAPAAWAIVLRHAPALKMIVAVPMIQPQLSSMTIDSLMTYGAVNQAAVDAIDAELRQLPRSEWPQL